MKKILPYSLLLVLLAALLNLELLGERQAVSHYADASGAVDLLAFSTGEDLPEYNYLRGQMGMDNTILVEDLVLKSTQGTQGLWVALFDHEFELINHQCFDIGADPLAMASFLKYFEDRPTDSTAALVLQGTLHSGEDAGMMVYTNTLWDHCVHDGYFDPGLPEYSSLLGGEGWYAPESGSDRDNTYAWTKGKSAAFTMWINAPEDGTIYVGGYGIPVGNQQRHIFLSVNGQPAGKQPLSGNPGVMAFPISGSQLEAGLNYCELSTERTVSPFQANRGKDDRPLGVLVDYVKYQASADSLPALIHDPHPNNRESLAACLDPGLPGDSYLIQMKQWFPREKGKDGRRYAWTRKKVTNFRLEVQDPGQGEIVVTGYGVSDGQGDRYLTLKSGEELLGTVVLPAEIHEMHFPVPAEIGSADILNLTLELDRLTPAPGKDTRVLGMLVDEIRFERSGRPVYEREAVIGKTWVHGKRSILLPVGGLSGSKLHLGWLAAETVPLEVTIINQETNEQIFREQISTSGVSELTVVLPENIPTKAVLKIGVSEQDGSKGVSITRVVLEFISSEEIAGLFASLGAQAKPWLDEKASWTLVTTKRPGGWIPLSESYSLTSGVMSAVTVVPDRTRYDNYQGEFRRVD